MNPREKRLLENFNLTGEQWQKIFDFQEGKCAICGKPLDKRANTDHQHSDGLLRGILDFRCNSFLREWITPDFLEKALTYLLHPPATEALGAPHYGLPGRAGTKKRRKMIAKMKKEKQIA